MKKENLKYLYMFKKKFQVAFTEIMQMIWKRLNDHGKNWRHVYKALVLLEYLIKTGSEKV